MTHFDEGPLNLQVEIDRCTGCGLCLSECSTFQASTWEFEGPRGRIQLAEGLVQGKVPLSSPVLETFDRCLGCARCEEVCPTGVNYQAIRDGVQSLRSQVQKRPLEPKPIEKDLHRCASARKRWWFKRRLQKSFLGAIHSTACLPRPNLQTGDFTLIPSCMQELLAPEQIQATISCAEILGISLGLGAPMNCCGALFQKTDKEDASRSYAQEFLNSLGSTHRLLDATCQRHCHHHAPGLSLDSLATQIEAAMKGRQCTLYRQIYYVPGCGGQAEVWNRILASIEGLKLRQASSKACCGGFGFESLCNSMNAKACFSPFAEELDEEALVVTPSMECWLQFRRHSYDCRHPIEIIYEAIQPH